MIKRPSPTPQPVANGVFTTLAIALAAGCLHGWMAQAGVKAPRPQVGRSASPVPDYSQMTDQEKARYQNQLSNQTREYQMEAIQARDKALVERVGRSVKIPPVRPPAPLPRVATPQSQQARQAQQARAREAERARLSGQGNPSDVAATVPSPVPRVQPTGPTSFVEVSAYGWSPFGRTETLSGGAPVPLVQVNRAFVGNLAPGSAPLGPFVGASAGSSTGWTPTPTNTDPPSCDGGAHPGCCEEAARGTVLTKLKTPRCCDPLYIPAGFNAHPRCVDDPPGGSSCDPALYAPHCCEGAASFDKGGGQASIPAECCEPSRGRPLIPLPPPYCP